MSVRFNANQNTFVPVWTPYFTGSQTGGRRVAGAAWANQLGKFPGRDRVEIEKIKVERKRVGIT